MKEDSQLPPSKHIVWIGKESAFSNKVCQWTLDWLDEHKGLGIDTIIRTSGFEAAVSSLEEPLKIGSPPEMIIVDRSMNAVGVEHFSTMVSDCIPECWLVEFVTGRDTLYKSNAVIYLQKGFKKSDWEDLLEHCFIECPNPQWSKTASLT